MANSSRAMFFSAGDMRDCSRGGAAASRAVAMRWSPEHVLKAVDSTCSLGDLCVPRISRARMLIERGYFPSQLPPSFHTRDLGAHTTALISAWTPTGRRKPKQGKWELFSVARAGHFRRPTALVNPIPQVLLSGHLETYWGQVVGHFRASRLSASHPRFISKGRRAACIPSMRPLYDKRMLMSAGYKFVLRTDISRFFPTIYTHSIPWALHTKAIAKANRSPVPRYFGNIFDAAVQHCQDGQTLGLPIGPDSSHIIAEAVITAVDTLLSAKMGGAPVGLRYVDDYYLFFATQAEAEGALAHLSRSLRDFELQVNFDKTSIRPVWEMSDDFWTHEVRNAQIFSEARRQKSDINHFFEFLRRISAENADENVAVYGLKRACSVLIRPDNWSIFESHVCHLAMAHPNSLDFVARVFATYGRLGYALNLNRIGRLCDHMICDHAPLSHHSEVAWALWMCKELAINLSREAVAAVSQMHSSVCGLLLMDLERLGRLPVPIDMTYWRSFENSAALWEELWLLSYEAGVRGWGGFSDAHVRADPHFEELRVREVRFYDENRQLVPLFTVQEDALDLFAPGHEGFIDVAFFDREDAEDFLEFEDDEGEYGVPVETTDQNEDDLPF
jgi:reverse transcriptase-like protein